MSRTQNEVSVIGATKVIVGLSQIIRVTAGNYQCAETFKYFSGGSLEFVEPVLSGASTAAASGWGTGYLLGTNEAINIEGPAAFYLAATGATVTAMLLSGRTQGATYL